MCNWVPMLYSGGKKKGVGEIKIKNILKKFLNNTIKYLKSLGKKKKS